MGKVNRQTRPTFHCVVFFLFDVTCFLVRTNVCLLLLSSVFAHNHNIIMCTVYILVLHISKTSKHWYPVRCFAGWGAWTFRSGFSAGDSATKTFVGSWMELVRHFDVLHHCGHFGDYRGGPDQCHWSCIRNYYRWPVGSGSPGSSRNSNLLEGLVTGTD